MDQYSSIIKQMKPAVRPNQLQYLLEIAKVENYTNLYINYENLEEIPREVLEISSIQGLFLKRNLLKSLVRLSTYSCNAAWHDGCLAMM
jgi:hypothetical protein